MKKKDNKKVNDSDLKLLNDELGLEPPKIYRNEQRQRINADYYNEKENKKSNKHKKSKNKNNQNNKSRKKRKLKSKYRKILYALVVAFFTVCVLITLSLTVLFKIETITVEGNEKYETEQVLQVLPIEQQTNLFLANKKQAIDSLTTNLPYIYNVNIKRKIPSTIIVNIEEAKKFYTVKDNNSYYILLDDNFKVLETDLEYQPENALLIDGLAIENTLPGMTLEFSDPKIKESLTKVNDAVKALQIVEISAMYATDENHNYVVYDNRIIFNLGGTNKLEDKLYTALASVEKLEQTNPMVEGELNVASDKQYYFTEKKQ